MDDENDDFVAPTQPTAAASTREDEWNLKCMICRFNLSKLSILEREMHLNACLDHASVDTNAKYECPSCGKGLTDYNEQRRMAHVNACLDRISTTSSNQLPVQQPHDSAPSTAATPSIQSKKEEKDTRTKDDALYKCKICSLVLTDQDLLVRINHVKQCGKRHGVRAIDLREQANTSSSDDSIPIADKAMPSTTEKPENPPQNDAFAIMMRSSTTRPASSSTAASSVTTQSSRLISNAFDVLMKSSKTQAVLSASSAVVNTISSRWNWRNNIQTNNTTNNKKRRLNSSSNSNNRRCPEFKKIIGTQPPFIVDGFQYASKQLSSIYFLTHFHSDHYTGLQKSFDCGIIYCNDVTARLVVQELGIDPKCVHPVPMNTPVMIRDVQVTFMDANHCPGAAILLFRLPDGRALLHTGDFRFDKRMLTYGPLRPFLSETNRLHAVYLDTTYCDPKYVFPPQQVPIDHVVELIERHSEQFGMKVLFLFGSYSIGKERLYMEAANRLQRKVCVSKAKRKLIECFQWPPDHLERLTTDASVTNFHVVPMHELRIDHLRALLQKHRLRFHQIVGFRPTGWTFNRKKSQSISSCQQDPDGANVRIYGVPYSEHSSFEELVAFVQAMQPTQIVPTVNCHSDASVSKQLDALKRVAFHSIATMFQTHSDSL